MREVTVLTKERLEYKKPTWSQLKEGGGSFGAEATHGWENIGRCCQVMQVPRVTPPSPPPTRTKQAESKSAPPPGEARSQHPTRSALRFAARRSHAHPQLRHCGVRGGPETK